MREKAGFKDVLRSLILCAQLKGSDPERAERPAPVVSHQHTDTVSPTRTVSLFGLTYLFKALLMISNTV